MAAGGARGAGLAQFGSNRWLKRVAPDHRFQTATIPRVMKRARATKTTMGTREANSPDKNSVNTPMACPPVMLWSCVEHRGWPDPANLRLPKGGGGGGRRQTGEMQAMAGRSSVGRPL